MDTFSGFTDPAAWPNMADVLIKLGIGVLLGGAIGLERELNGRPAGIRTHMLLVVGVVLFAEASKHFADGDPTRIASNIVVGVGFLGAGTILRLGAEVKGLTSAASLWAVAGIGLAVSAGGALLPVAVVATLLCLFTLAAVNRIETRYMPGRHVRTLQVELQGREYLATVLERLEGLGLKVRGMRIKGRDEGLIVHIDLQGANGQLTATVAQCAGVTAVDVVD